MFKERFIELCTQKNVSPSYVCLKVGISPAAFSQWTDKTVPRKVTQKKIADFFGVTVDYLLEKKETATPTKRGVKINILGSVAAGIPMSAIRDVIDEEEITEELAAQGDFFGLAIKGDSMSPMIMNGDTVIVKAQPEVRDGDIAIALVGEEEATCKKIKKTPEGVMLIPLNSEYEPIFYTNKQIEQLPVRVIGKVVEQRRKL